MCCGPPHQNRPCLIFFTLVLFVLESVSTLIAMVYGGLFFQWANDCDDSIMCSAALNCDHWCTRRQLVETAEPMAGLTATESIARLAPSLLLPVSTFLLGGTPTPSDFGVSSPDHALAAIDEHRNRS